MIKTLSLIILITLFCGIDSLACINTEMKRLSDGTTLWIDEEGLVPTRHKIEKFNYAKKVLELKKKYEQTKKVNFLSDAGIVLILQAKYQEAKELYLRIDRLEPRRYATASNLGTVYELLGDNQNAIVWIKKAIEINPQSHHGSEWLHVKILEAKINGDQSISSDFLINTNFGMNPMPENNMSQEQLIQLRDALFFQLNERVTFIKPPDKIIANLMFDLANANYFLGLRRDAVAIYEKAREYGFGDPILQARIEKAKEIPIKEKPSVAEEPKSNNLFLWIIFGTVSFIILALITLMVRKTQQKLN
jgi:tetratricopeptide (TPR) repeat protein